MADFNGPQKDWYSILGANPSDDIQEIKQKYQKLILMVGTEPMFPIHEIKCRINTTVCVICIDYDFIQV